MNKQLLIWTIIVVICYLIACDYEIIPDETGSNAGSELPKACFQTNTIYCEVGCTANFDATCSENATRYNWDFDGNNVFEVGGENEQITSYTYNENGNYKAILQVQNAVGITDTSSVDIQIYESGTNLKACFKTDKNICNITDCEITFDASCSAPATDIVRYKWDFDGDGVFSAGGEDIVKHIYNNVDIYESKLQVQNSSGQTKDTTMTIKVTNSNIYFNNETPEVRFTVDEGPLLRTDCFAMANYNIDTITVDWILTIVDVPQAEVSYNQGEYRDAWLVQVNDEILAHASSNGQTTIPPKEIYNWKLTISGVGFLGYELPPGTGTVSFQARDIGNGEMIATFNATIIIERQTEY